MVEREKLTKRERVAAGASLMWLLIGAIVAATLCGCVSDRQKNIDLDGMYVNGETGTMAIGAVEFTAEPTGGESALLKIDQDTPWVNPTGEKMNHVRCMLTGSNCCEKVEAVFSAVCKAFLVQTNAVPAISAETK